MNTRCPYCTGRKVLAGFNDLASLFPKLAKEWDAELNGAAAPYRGDLRQLTPGLVAM